MWHLLGQKAPFGGPFTFQKGRIADFLKENLWALGVTVKECRLCPPDVDALAAELKASAPLYNYVFVSGGVSPGLNEGVTAKGEFPSVEHLHILGSRSYTLFNGPLPHEFVLRASALYSIIQYNLSTLLCSRNVVQNSVYMSHSRWGVGGGSAE